MKRISIKLLHGIILSLFIFLFTTNALAGEVYTHNLIYQYEKEYSEAMFVKYLGTGTSVYVPSYMGGYPVTSVVRPAFENNKTVESVTLPYTVEELGNHTFYKSTALKTVDMSNCSKLTKIGANCFNGCKSLTTVKLPNSVSQISSNAFTDCTSLVSITLPNSIRSLGTSVFSGCSKLSSITLPSSLTTLSSFTFSSCYALKEVRLSAGMKTISSNAFFNCYSIESLYIPKTLTTINTDAFNCSSVKNIYYAGSKAEWNSISIAENNKSVLSKATIHYLGEPHVHEHKKTVTPASCTADGKTIYRCDCGNTYSEIIKKSGHIFSDVPAEKATMKKDGLSLRYCKNCSYSEKRNIYAISQVTLAADKFTYNGKNCVPDVTVKDSKGISLKKNSDYILTYPKISKAAGTYTVTVTFKGNYSGSKKLTYKVVPDKPGKLTADTSASAIKLKWSAVKGANGYKIYIYNSKGKLQYTETTAKTAFKFTGLKKATVYKFKIKAYIKSGKNKIWSDATGYFTTATSPSAPLLKAVGEKGRVKLSWTKQKGADGYIVYMSADKNGKFKSVSNEEGVANLSMTKKGLKNKKNYFFKVRAYKLAGKAKIYSSYSKVVKVKTK